MGSLAGGTSEDGGDTNGFKILAFSEKRGADALQCVPGPDAAFAGSPQYQKGKVAGPNRVGQYHNLAIWLVKDGKAPWRWLIPQSVRVTQDGGVTFLECDRTWVALRPLGTTPFQVDDKLTQQVAGGEKPRFPGHQVLSAAGQAERFCGLAVEVGDAQTHGTFAEFRRKALAARVDASKLAGGEVEYRAADGKTLRLQWSDDPKELGVWRDGRRHDWAEHARYLYRTADAAGQAGPLSSPWGSGRLFVQAGRYTFNCSVGDDGRVTFENGG